VVLLALVVSAGLLGGLARPPLGTHAVHPRLRHAGLLGGGAVLNAASLLFDGNVAILSLAASLVVLIAFAVTNRHVTGIAVVGLGLLVNLAPVAMDGGMPVRPGALVRAGLVAPDDWSAPSCGEPATSRPTATCSASSATPCPCDRSARCCPSAI